MKVYKFYFLSFLFIFNLNAFDEFLVSDIRIIGLQRVSTGSIFNVIPISVGDKIDSRKSIDITKSLFSTEQFDDIQIAKDGNTLIISVVERPSISAIDISGNKALKTEQLIESLDGVGIKEGEVYKRSTLENVKSELVRSYASNGRYGAGVEIDEIKSKYTIAQVDKELYASKETRNGLYKSATSFWKVATSEGFEKALEADLEKANAAMVNQVNQFNEQTAFERDKFNTANAQAIEQANVAWRRQANTINTAAQNQINMQNAMNAFGMSSQSMSFLWQELRDQADFDFRSYENEENRKSQIIATAMANEGEAGETYDDYLTSLLSSLSSSYKSGLGTYTTTTTGGRQR